MSASRRTVEAVATRGLTTAVAHFGRQLVIAGPDAVPGFQTGGTIAFRIDGATANETAVHDLGSGAAGTIWI